MPEPVETPDMERVTFLGVRAGTFPGGDDCCELRVVLFLTGLIGGGGSCARVRILEK